MTILLFQALDIACADEAVGEPPRLPLHLSGKAVKPCLRNVSAKVEGNGSNHSIEVHPLRFQREEIGFQVPVRKGVSWHRLIVLIGVLLLFSARTFAINPNTPILQYAHTAWRVQDGLLSGSPVAITQTRDGYLWIGTQTDLLRFDGVKFTARPISTAAAPIKGQITSLFGASDGSLWIGTQAELEHWDGKTLTRFENHLGWITGVAESRSGEIWVTRVRVADRGGSLCKAVNDKLQCFRIVAGDPDAGSAALAFDPSGTIWAGGNSLIRFPSGKGESYPLPALKRMKGLAGITSVNLDPHGGLWVGAAYAGLGLGPQHFDNGRFHSLHLAGLDTSTIAVRATLLDRNGSLWVGTAGDGIYRLRGDKAEHYRSSNGLSGDAVKGLFQDREGSVWVATNNGIDRFHDLSVLTYANAQHLVGDSVESVVANRDGSIWAGTESGVNILQGDKTTVLGIKSGLRGQQVTSMMQDRAGRMWVGIDNGLYRISGQHVQAITRKDGTPVGIVRWLAETNDGTIYIYTIMTGRNIYQIEPSSVIAIPTITEPSFPWDMAVGADNDVWVIGRKGEFGRLRNGRFEKVTNKYYEMPENKDAVHTAADALLRGPDGTLYIWAEGGLILIRGTESRYVPRLQEGLCQENDSWLFDKSGALWVASSCGLTRFELDEVRQWWTSQAATKQPRLVLGVTDGFGNGRVPFRPRMSLAPDGKLWIASPSGLLSLDPANLALNDKKPPVYIESVIANHRRMDVSNGMELPIHTRDLELDYTALSFVTPSKVIFRYKLEGKDNDWQNAGSRRDAFYTDLPPGHYTFRVIACNNSGLWNDQGALLNFSVLPAWYQTLWFKALSAASAIFFLWVFVILRLRNIERRIGLRFEAQMSERMRIARDLHDTLLQSLQGLILSFSSFSAQVSAPPNILREMEGALDKAEDLLVSGRERIRDLRSSGAASRDLVDEIRAMIDRLTGGGANIQLRVDGHNLPIKPLVQDEVLWILREALTNACQHSKGTGIWVNVLKTRNSLQCSVQDDGRGMDQHAFSAHERGHFGLVGMRERSERVGGRLNVRGDPGKGTLLVLAIPARIAYEIGDSRFRRFISGRA